MKSFFQHGASIIERGGRAFVSLAGFAVRTSNHTRKLTFIHSFLIHFYLFIYLFSTILKV